MDTVTQCPSHSTGAGFQLFGLLIQTIMQSQCNISPSSFWPEDYGPELIKNGDYFI